MHKTLKELDKVLAFMLESHKKGLEVYFEEVVELLQPVENNAHVNDILGKLIDLGYVIKNAETNNFLPTLDGKIFFENSKNSKPFSEQMKLELGTEKSTVVVSNNASTFFRITLAGFFVVVVAISFFVYSNQIKIQDMKEDLEIKDSLIMGLKRENKDIKEKFNKRFEKNKKSIDWHTIQIRNIEEVIKDKKKAIIN